jgi:hypothetical protein
MRSIVVPEMTSPTTASCVWRMGLTAVTSTCSVAPTVNVTSMRAFCPDSSLIGFVSKGRKFCAWAFTT